jgi:DNA-binding helix-hairpin-helix protein with protein kinase domain
MAIGDYIDKHNQNPKPFIWTAKASDILEKVKRAQQYYCHLFMGHYTSSPWCNSTVDGGLV